ncbi:MAG: WYL domain-containing protein [Lachnospiraceae bacterium]|nr:WYL domain-containing protein [Lachnospiraceae bacterium]
MPAPAKQKIKLLYLLKVLLENTDENHCMNTQDLIVYLEENDIFVERKTIFSDIATLKEFGIDVCVSKSKENGGYYIASRDFELAELKIIVEAILSSRYISAKKSKSLIEKLESLVGPSERKELQREVFVQGRVKTDNESIFYNVDMLHSAMMNNNEITFSYLDWNKNKELVPRKGGKLYRVSPWALTVKDEYYYLIAFDANANIIKHYRVDKMKDIHAVNRSKRSGHEAFDVYDVGEYTNQNFGMFSGDADVVSLVIKEDKIGIIFDRFGKDIDIRPVKKDYISCRVPVLVSKQFFGWLAGLGDEIEITSPKSVKEEYINYLKNLIKSYE